MSWSVTIPGDPPSGNHANKIGRGFRRGGVSFPKIVKTAEAEAYQQGAALLVRTAKPSGWTGGGAQIRLTYRAFLSRDIDCDNISKVVGDAIKGAINIDDSFFLICFASKVIDKANPRIEVTLEAEEISTPCHACGTLLGDGR